MGCQGWMSQQSCCFATRKSAVEVELLRQRKPLVRPEGARDGEQTVSPWECVLSCQIVSKHRSVLVGNAYRCVRVSACHSPQVFAPREVEEADREGDVHQSTYIFPVLLYFRFQRAAPESRCTGTGCASGEGWQFSWPIMATLDPEPLPEIV